MEWTPCSKKVPDKTGYYLATVKDTEKNSVWVIYFYRPTKTWYEDQDSAYHEYDKYSPDDILAWMPVPKPYDSQRNLVEKIDELLLEIEKWDNKTIDCFKKDGMIVMGNLIKWIITEMDKEEKYKVSDEREEKV